MEETDEVLPEIKETDDLLIKKEFVKSSQVVPENEVKNIMNEKSLNRMGVTNINNQPKILSEARQLIHLGTKPTSDIKTQMQPMLNNQKQMQMQMTKETFDHNQELVPSKSNEPKSNQPKSNEPKIMEFDKPNPWTKIIIVPLEEFPYFFHIKATVPSLNDFENWKQVIPNINFDPRAGELIIPSKDEPSALALANLILINFSGQMSLQNILEKNLIQISIAKAKSYELVQNKLREQIMENLYGKQFNSVETNYEQDLAKKKTVEKFTPPNSSNPGRIDFKSDSFVDTFEHFSNKSNEPKNIEAWDGNDFSYI
jgi:hypothetical protein